MVSYAGESTVSGVSPDTMIHTIFIYLFTMTPTGAVVIVSRYIGRGNLRQGGECCIPGLGCHARSCRDMLYDETVWLGETGRIKGIPAATAV